MEDHIQYGMSPTEKGLHLIHLRCLGTLQTEGTLGRHGNIYNRKGVLLKEECFSLLL